MVVTDDYRLHEKDGHLFRQLAEAVGVREELEKGHPDIWQ
jgi:hypothetical protein